MHQIVHVAEDLFLQHADSIFDTHLGGGFGAELDQIAPGHVERIKELVGEGKVLTNPSDDDSKRVFEAGEHDHTDQFMLKFQKPRK